MPVATHGLLPSLLLHANRGNRTWSAVWRQSRCHAAHILSIGLPGPGSIFSQDMAHDHEEAGSSFFTTKRVLDHHRRSTAQSFQPLSNAHQLQQTDQSSVRVDWWPVSLFGRILSSNNCERRDHITSEPLKVYFGGIFISNCEATSLCVLEIARLLRQTLKISYFDHALSS